MTGTDTVPARRRASGWIIGGLAICVAVVIGAALFASGDPDGLERGAEDTGFVGAAEGSPFSIIADYAFPGLTGPMATIVAGLIGVAVLFGVAWLLGRALARPRS